MLKKLLLLVTLITTITVGQHITGSGTSEDPYILYNAADFDSIRYLGLTNDYYYSLGADINFTDFGAWTPITSRGFNLNGNGYAISGLTDWNIARVNGLIDTLFISASDTVTLKNFDLENCTFVMDSSYPTAGDFLDIIASGILIGVVKAANDSKLYLNKIKANRLTMHHRFNQWARTFVGILVGRIDKLDNFTVYQVSIDSSFLWSLNGNSSSAAFNYNGGIVGRWDSTQTTSTATFREVSVSNTTFWSYDWKDWHHLGGFWGYLGGDASGGELDTITLKDCYAKDVIYYLDTAHGRKWGIFGGPIGTDFNSKRLNIENIYTVGQVVKNWDGSLITTPYSNYGFFMLDAFTSKWNISGVYADTTQRYICIQGNDDYFGVVGWPTVTPLTPAQLQNSDNMPLFNFVDIWGINSERNDGYPFLTWGTYNESNISIWSPSLGSTYYAQDTIFIKATLLNVDTLFLEYTDNNGFSWNIIDTLYATDGDTAIAYNWVDYPLGEYDAKIRIKSLNRFSNPFDVSKEFTIASIKSIQILSPISEIIKNVGGLQQDTIVVRCQNIEKFSLYYSIEDTLTWTEIILDIPVTSNIDTVSYIWTMPQEFGKLYILAREISDTTQYVFERPGISLGNVKRSYPQICWYMQTYFGASFTNYIQTPIEWNWVVDLSCGWTSFNKERVTALIDDKAEGNYTFYSDDQPISFAKDNPIQAGSVYLYTLLDTTSVRIGNFYDSGGLGDTLEYKDRVYFIVPADSTLRCKDLVNDIDSILITDLTPYFSGHGWYNLPSRIAVYNVQHSKVIDQYFPVNQDFESLNDPDFKGKFLMTGNKIGGGYLTIGVELLAEPIDPTWVQDIENIYSEISYTRDYFRGINPKARKTR